MVFNMWSAVSWTGDSLPEYSIGEFDYFPSTVFLGGPLLLERYKAYKSRAAFAQLTYDLGKLAPAVEGLSVTAGYRYTHDELYQGTLILAAVRQRCR